LGGRCSAAAGTHVAHDLIEGTFDKRGGKSVVKSLAQVILLTGRGLDSEYRS